MKGFLDGEGEHSSKRLQSIIALGLAGVTAVIALVFKFDGYLAGGMVGSFLLYSAAMQGVSYLAEKK